MVILSDDTAFLLFMPLLHTTPYFAGRRCCTRVRTRSCAAGCPICSSCARRLRHITFLLGTSVRGLASRRALRVALRVPCGQALPTVGRLGSSLSSSSSACCCIRCLAPFWLGRCGFMVIISRESSEQTISVALVSLSSSGVIRVSTLCLSLMPAPGGFVGGSAGGWRVDARYFSGGAHSSGVTLPCPFILLGCAAPLYRQRQRLLLTPMFVSRGGHASVMAGRTAPDTSAPAQPILWRLRAATAPALDGGRRLALLPILSAATW